VNLKDSASLCFGNAGACWKEPFFIKVGLGCGDVTIVEGDSLFPSRKNFGNLGIMLRISQLDFHHLHFISTPELPLLSPLVSRRPPLFLKRMNQREEIFLIPSGIESRAEGIFESTKGSILPFDPENHRGLQRIEVEEPSPDFHKLTCQKIAGHGA
jgi:hypothetical protein